MTHLLKTTAIAAIAMSTALPAFADGHMDINSMTCAQFNDLSDADKTKVAVAAISELNTDAATETEGMAAPKDTNADPDAADVNDEGAATAEAPRDGETVTEEQTGVTTSEMPQGGDNLGEFEAEMKIMIDQCERNGDTMVTEAAAGLTGTR